MEKLFEHTLQRQIAEQNAKIDKLASLLERQLAIGSQGAASPKTGIYAGPAGQINTGPVINVANIAQQNNTVIQINPWDGEKRIAVDVGQIAAAFVENMRLKEYAGWPDHQLTDPELAPPYVTEFLMDLVRRGHADPSARNVYLNPRRADQVLVHLKTGQWEVLPLTEATRLLFDGVVKAAYQVMMTHAEMKLLPLEAQNAMSLAGMMYKDEPEEYVKRAKGPITAHLTNTAPQGP